jgi:hypothetical protein
MQESSSFIPYIKRYLKRCITGPWSLLCGLSVTFKYFIDPRRIVTEQYPENRKTLKMHPRYRGRLEMIEDADGSLLILDTGGWYKLCCPSSQLVKPDVKGAIYRVKKVGAHKVADPRGEKIEWEKLNPEQTARLMADRHPCSGMPRGWTRIPERFARNRAPLGT